MRRRRGSIVLGVVLIALGGWLVAGGLGLSLPGFGQVWPALLVAFGLSMLAQSAGDGVGNEGYIFAGLIGILSGAFLLLFALGALEWREMSLYWPTFPLIVGLAFFALFLAGGMRDPGLLVPAFVVGGFGVFAFPFTLGAIQSPLLNRLARLWPLLILILGLAFIFRPEQQIAGRRIGRILAPASESPSDVEPGEEPPDDPPPDLDADAEEG